MGHLQRPKCGDMCEPVLVAMTEYNLGENTLSLALTSPLQQALPHAHCLVAPLSPSPLSHLPLPRIPHADCLIALTDGGAVDGDGQYTALGTGHYKLEGDTGDQQGRVDGMGGHGGSGGEI